MRRSRWLGNPNYDKDALHWIANLTNEDHRLLLAKLSGHPFLRLVVCEEGQLTSEIKHQMQRRHLNPKILDRILYRHYDKIRRREQASA